MSISVSACLWFDDRAAEAHAFYQSVFSDDASYDPHESPRSDGPFNGTLSLPGIELRLFDAGPHDEFNDAISLFVSVETQDEVDMLWTSLGDGGSPGRCGWVTDRFGVRWQIVPTALGRLMGGGDPDQSFAVRNAMLAMSKLVIADLEAAAQA